jgi:hypothetical protein
MNFQIIYALQKIYFVNYTDTAYLANPNSGALSILN